VKHAVCPLTAEDPQAEAVTRWRALLGDNALFGHVNTIRYVLLMEIARIHYLRRAGLLGSALRKRWIMPVATMDLDLHRPVKPFERFEIVTQVLSWDDRWLLMRHTFRSAERTGPTIATAYVKIVIRSPSGFVEPAQVVRMVCGRDVRPPKLGADLWARFGIGRRSAVGGRARRQTRHQKGQALVEVVNMPC
jgi:acyl-CoA thioesterase FadM